MIRFLHPLLPLVSLALLACSSGSGGGRGGDGGSNVSVTTLPGTAPALTVRTTPGDAQIAVRTAGGQLLALPGNGVRIPLSAGSYTVVIHKVRFQSVQHALEIDVDTTLTTQLVSEAPVTPLPCGPLRVSAANPRYFADDCRIRYLAGSHTWNNLNDMGLTQPPPVFDFPAFRSFLGANGMNATRLFAWEVPHPDDSETPLRDWAAPQTWVRSGPGTAIDGLPKFDLSIMDESYFVRMRERVRALQDSGIYVIVMLFEGWSVQFSPGRASHPFGAANNVNGIDPGDLGQIDTLAVPAITDLQEAYVRKVVDTVNDLDNVLYEIANEASAGSVAWQYHMIDFVKSYERAKPKVHPVGMTALPVTGASQDVLYQSPADWVSPKGGVSPDPATGAKVVLYDNDHITGSRSGDEAWIWKSFAQGMSTLFMDCYVPPDSLCDTPYPPAAGIRRAQGATRRYAERMNLASALPSGQLASSGYCLASDSEILVFVPNGGAVTVDLPAGQFNAEWYELASDHVSAAASVPGGAPRTLTPPFAGPAVVFLWLPHP